ITDRYAPWPLAFHRQNAPPPSESGRHPKVRNRRSWAARTLAYANSNRARQVSSVVRTVTQECAPHTGTMCAVAIAV
ncbi:hypothetical protein ABZY05_49920, partial [Streptomyces canus]|uniref:hypothetical protein n=1 Tax=Streptomyces canus TaxID=58343 RepID=UPI0033B86E8F